MIEVETGRQKAKKHTQTKRWIKTPEYYVEYLSPTVATSDLL